MHELGNKIFHLDHIISINELTTLIEKDGLDGLPMSHMANICLISEELNNRKNSKSAINFLHVSIAKFQKIFFPIFRDNNYGADFF